MGESQQRTKTFGEEQQPARALDSRYLLACLAISIFLVVWITLASGSFNLRSAVFLLVLPWVLLRAGGIITAALRLPSFFALDFLLGVAIVSVGVIRVEDIRAILTLGCGDYSSDRGCGHPEASPASSA
jgi:hypothetical protein